MKKPKRDDPKQSRKFIEAAKALAADGDVTPTEAAKRVDRLVGRAKKKADNDGGSGQ